VFTLCCVITGDSGNVDGPTSSSAVKTVPPLCPEGTCTPIPKPISDTSATVYVILGLKAIDRSMITREHVLEEKVNSSSLQTVPFFI